MRRRIAVLTASVLVVVLGACSSDQDPGLTPEGGTNDGPNTTSHVLPKCDTATDATVPVGGCLDAYGAVVNPDEAP